MHQKLNDRADRPRTVVGEDDMKARRRVGAVAILALVTISSIAGCGPDDPVQLNGPTERDGGVDWLVGESFSSPFSLQVLDVPDLGAAIVDTAALDGSTRRVQARWSEQGETVVTTDRDRPALVFPWAWATGNRLFVAGFACPDPMLQDISLVDVDRVAGCGGSAVSYVIRSLDVSTHRWSELNTQIPAIDGRTVDVIAVGRRRAVFAGADEQAPSERSIYLVDLNSHERTTVSGPVDRLSMCELDGHLVGLETDASGASTNGGAMSRFVSVSASGLKGIRGAVDRQATFLGCAENAIALWLPSTSEMVLANYSDGAIESKTLTMPAGSAGVRIIAQKNLDGNVALWKDDGTSFGLWQLTNSAWSECPVSVAGSDPPLVVSVIDCEAVVSIGNGNHLGIAK